LDWREKEEEMWFRERAEDLEFRKRKLLGFLQKER